jgi:hypothetical protein
MVGSTDVVPLALAESSVDVKVTLLSLKAWLPPGAG